ncbi:MAG: SpoVR family protein [Planctomycetes bacterium]|jgi:stage V sporulation protein R|nr:SpoVR family protein [Planctomycetota bacterium]MDP6409014.1 SpoVR family protein [Planctomycetota bacterium]
MGSLTAELSDLSVAIEDVARDSGLDFFDVSFELLDARDVNAIASYGGFPVRYPSWRFGMEYERLEKGYRFGLSKIYELVINNDPTYAYLVSSNSLMEQKLVMAHVFGHADFFKHNVWFQPTERQMVDVMASHGTRMRRYVDAFGQDCVERFLDLALALDTLIDPYLPVRHLRGGAPVEGREDHLSRAKRSLDRACSSPVERRLAPVGRAPAPAPGGPTFDVLGFLAEGADLDEWQRDVLRMVRAEAHYFAPQRMTKIMNEGWASFWHSRILTRGVLEVEEIVDFADCHSGATATAPGQLNPYKLGIDLFRYAEEKGMDLFELRALHNDVSFIDAVVDEEFAERSRLFVYARNSRTGRTEVVPRDWREIKEELLRSLSWGGLPRIELADVDHDGRGELLLRHHFDGRELQLDQAGELLVQLASLWGRPVHLLTREEGGGRRLTADGGEVRLVEVPGGGETIDRGEGLRAG